ncbi:DUF1254 domain-containing protein, partial [Streptomyces clavuligerus]
MKIVVRLNLDTLYSQAWLDLTAEPLVLSVPVMDDDPAHPRYWLMQTLDFWTNTVQDPTPAATSRRTAPTTRTFPPPRPPTRSPTWTAPPSSPVSR